MDSPIGIAKYHAETASQIRQSTVTESLELRKANLQAQLDRVNAALEALKSNPEIEKTLNLIQQASY